MLLNGFRLIDLTQGPPGATCSHLLADMGMEVIRVQAPGREAATDRAASNVAFDTIHRNKRSMFLDLRSPEAQEVFHKLASRSDAVLESFRPGVTGRLGIDYQKIHAVNPKLVYCSISAYGQDGPYAGFAAHDSEVSAGRGAWSKVGDTIGTPGSLVNALMADTSAGLHAALGIVSGLLARSVTGAGQYIDVSLADCLSTQQLSRLQGLLISGKVSPSAHGDRAVFLCKDGKYLIQANVEPQNWERFCKVVGRPDFADLPDADSPSYKGMVAELSKIMLTKTRDEWFYEITAAGASAGQCMELEEVLDDPQIRHREMVWDVEHPTAGKGRQWGFPMQFSDGPITLRNFAPTPGQDTDAILEELGYSASERKRFQELSTKA